MPFRLCGYGRVSTREQSENSHALDQQIDRLKEAGATEILIDIDSGSSDRRPNFQKLLKLIEENEIQEVIITRIDRLTRKLSTLLKIRAILEKSSCNLRALDDSIDLSTPAGKFHFNLLGSLAEMETDRLSERVLHGWESMRKNRRVAIAPFGYKVAKGKLEHDTSEILCTIADKRTWTTLDIASFTIDAFFEAKALRGCCRLFNERFGIKRFTNGRGRSSWWKLGWSHTGLRDWLTNPVLLGHTCYPLKRGRTNLRSRDDWQIFYNTHEPILTLGQSGEIKEILANNKLVKGYGANKRRHAIAGLVFCAECRSACYSLAGTRGKTPGYNYYFQCKNYRIRACDQKKTIRVEKINDFAINALIAKSENLALLADKSQTKPLGSESSEMRSLKAQLKGLDSLGFNSALLQAKKDIERQIASLEKQSDCIGLAIDSRFELFASIFKKKDFWESQSQEDLTKIFRKLISQILVKNGEIVAIEFRED